MPQGNFTLSRCESPYARAQQLNMSTSTSLDNITEKRVPRPRPWVYLTDLPSGWARVESRIFHAYNIDIQHFQWVVRRAPAAITFMELIWLVGCGVSNTASIHCYCNVFKFMHSASHYSHLQWQTFGRSWASVCEVLPSAQSWLRTPHSFSSWRLSIHLHKHSACFILILSLGYRVDGSCVIWQTEIVPNMQHLESNICICDIRWALLCA